MTDEADRIGRYQLRRVLGQGGMGVVYEAWDPALDRIVALKLLRPGLGSASFQARLVREAQAMAKLCHPNVVTVHDIGRAGEQPYIVMDLIRGASLRHWWHSGPRSLDQVLTVFARAAEGLSAAHGVGLVHRDFKPENVLIADDGRVLVSDFGLAVADEQELEPSTIAHEGSPAYMAPEQQRGTSADALSDQFSFALSLEEAVRGLRPPGWLARTIERGLRADPSERFPSMQALTGAIKRGRARRLWGRAAAGAVVTLAVLGSVAFWAGGRRQHRQQLCRGGAAEIAATWNPTLAAQLRGAFERTRSPLWPEAWRGVVASFDAYSIAWQSAHRRVCEATRVRGEQSEALLDAKMSCLGEQLQLFKAVGAVLQNADDQMLERVPTLLQVLHPVAACEDRVDLAQAAPPPRDEQIVAVETARRIIAQAAAIISAGRYTEGLTVAIDGAKAAAESHYLPAVAEGALWIGIAHGRLGHQKDAELALGEAASSASAGRANVIAVRAWIQLMHFVGFDGKRSADGLRYNDYAEAALRSMPGSVELDAERLAWLSAIWVYQRRYPEALAASHRQLALVEARFGTQHRLYASALDGVAGVLEGQGKARDALDPQGRACDILERVLGAPHPQLALCLNNLAALHGDLGEHEVAVRLKLRALEMFRQLPGHPQHAAMTHRNLARSFLEVGRLEEAADQLRAASAVSGGEGDEVINLCLHGQLLRRQHKLREALAEHRLAVKRSERAEPSRKLEALLALAEAALANGELATSASVAEEAAQLAETLYGASSFRLAAPLRLQADALIQQRQLEKARPLAERANRSLADAQIDPLVLARVQFCLVRALQSEAGNGARARELAAAAKRLSTLDARDPGLVTEIDRWITRHPAGAP